MNKHFCVDELTQLVYPSFRDAGLRPECALRLSGCAGLCVRMSSESLSRCYADVVRMLCDCRPFTVGIATKSTGRDFFDEWYSEFRS